MAFGVLDYLVLLAVLLISIGIGIYARFTGSKQKTNDDFLLANRTMSVVVVSFSLMASFMSAISILGLSSEIYQYGTQFIVINIAYGFGTFFASEFYLPVFYKLQATSAYEYLEKRFGKIARLSASISYSLQMILYMGIVVYAPALALESTVGIDKKFAIVIIGVTVIIYCCVGGIRAVLWTDVFQSMLMFCALFLVIISGVIYANGIQNIFIEADKGGRLELWNFNIDPTERHSWFSLIIGGMLTYLTLYGVNQTQIQRLMTVKSLAKAKRALWWNWPILTALSLTTTFSALVIFYYYRNCDPLLANRITKEDQIMPIYVTDALSHIPGVVGLFVAGIFSASLSTVSSCLNSLAAITLEDYLKPIYKLITKKNLELNGSALPSKIIAGIYGVICILIAFMAESFGRILQISLTIFGTVGGPLLALFTLGMSLINANEYGSVIGLFTGIVVSMWIGFAKKPRVIPLKAVTSGCSEFIEASHKFGLFNVTSIPQSSLQSKEYFYLFRLSYWYTVVIGFLVTFIIGYFASLFLKSIKHHGTDKIYLDENKSSINFDLFFPPIAKRLRMKHAKKETLISNVIMESMNEKSISM